MRIPFATSLVVLLLLSVSRATAAEEFDPAARAAAVAPYLDDQAIAVAHIDLKRVDVEAAFQEFVAVFLRAEGPAPPGFGVAQEVRTEVADVQTLVERWTAELTRVGGRELYLVFSLADFPRKPFYVIAPVKEDGDHRAVAGLLYSGRPDGPDRRDGRREISERIGDVVFFGSRETLARLKMLKPTPRPELAAAFKAAGDTTAQILFIPTEDNRRVLREMLPPIPEQFGGGSGKQIADGLQWAAMGIELPPRLAASLVVQSKDAQSAEKMKRLVQAGYRLLGQVEDVKKIFPKFDELTAMVAPTIQGDRLEIALDRQRIDTVLDALSVPMVRAREAARRTQCMSNFKQLGTAMCVYHEANKRFPAAATYDKDGTKLLSWRVQLLPYLGEENLYRQFHLDESWDSPHNRKLIAMMPRVFACPGAGGAGLAKNGMTMYVAPLGEKAVFGGKQGTANRDIRDGASNTIMLLEVDPEHAIVWTKPDDLPIDPDNPLHGLSGRHEGGFNVVFCDGHVQFMETENIDPKKLRAMFTRDGGEPIN
jgi:prepilin-type processing-associated H-X9-DG protein